MSDTHTDDATLAVRSPLSVGELFAGRYEIERVLGRGGMGSVFRVHDREVGEVVALKLLDIMSATPEVIDRFRREVRLARRVTHRNVARTYDLGEFQGWRFLTMEYVDGESLRTFLARNRPSHARAIDFARQIAEGLAAAHQAGVIHRDLKPANVMLERSGRVVLTDFGIARALQGNDATLQTGGLLGTPAYMAPEQISGDRVGAPADIYALGLILFEMLTGRLPFSGDTAMAMAMARINHPLPDLRTQTDVPPELVGVLEGCLARGSERRIINAAEVVERLASSAVDFGRDDGPLSLATINVDTNISALPPAPRTTALTSVSTPTTTTSGRALAVLPFRYRGPEAELYIAEALSDELIDVLSTMRGLKVSGSGATARFAEAGSRDPRTIGRELGVDVIVDGTVQLAGKRVRISARLLDVGSGFQLWSERYDGPLSDVFELQDKMGKRIAEALRLKLEDIAHRGEAPADAVETYLRARQLARAWDWKGPKGAVVCYEQTLALAPEFKPALSGYAIACLRAWFVPRDLADEPDWRAKADAAVAKALELAPELAETQLAAAMHAVHHGEYRSAAGYLAASLRIAPTYAAAHEYLGRLQLEAGRPEQGVGHLEFALELDPSLVFVLPDIARYKALRGDAEGFAAQMARFAEVTGARPEMRAIMLDIRASTWLDDRQRVDQAHQILLEHIPEASLTSGFARMMASEAVSEDELRENLQHVCAAAPNPRFTSMVRQFAAEVAARHGFDDLALEIMQEAAESVLVDLDWLEHCPLFDRLRARLAFEGIRALVRSRAEAIWVTPRINSRD
ncbi:protein kinase [Pseudenhygromyxa sp. WMMC2535]|uniref:protein kinase domain-containing protein n=1 Tax=Pseudenhygromyxa sp. WMMC2535 TaxID=2712867 RepID=UPI0031FA270B